MNVFVHLPAIQIHTGELPKHSAIKHRTGQRRTPESVINKSAAALQTTCGVSSALKCSDSIRLLPTALRAPVNHMLSIILSEDVWLIFRQNIFSCAAGSDSQTLHCPFNRRQHQFCPVTPVLQRNWFHHKLVHLCEIRSNDQTRPNICLKQMFRMLHEKLTWRSHSDTVLLESHYWSWMNSETQLWDHIDHNSLK